MKQIDEFLEKIAADPRCEIIRDVVKLPELARSDLLYPADVSYFYTKCNGLRMFIDSGYADCTIVPAENIMQANMIIVGEECNYDISSSWYVICKDGNGDYLSIDLSQERLGKCYNSHHESHGLVGDCPIIALSFTELLNELYKTNGEDIFWRDKNYGDAYN